MSITRETATAKQREALDTIVSIAGKRTASPTVVVVCGYAGTGKTSLLKLVEEEVGESIIVAPTGKAALRVREATACAAQTYHKYLYKPRTDDRTGEVVFDPKGKTELQAPESGLIIGDESSMVDEKLFTELIEAADKVGANVVLLGDSFQLPPVAGRLNVLLPAFPADRRIELTEVMRQALDSPIIRASMYVRQNKMVEALDLLPHLLPSALLDKIEEVLGRGGAVICHTNRMRHQLNCSLRERHQFEPNTLEPGEPLLVLKNNYQVDLFNGEGTQFAEWLHGPDGPHLVTDRYNGREGDYYFGRASILRQGEEQKVRLCLDEVAGLVPEDGPSMSALAFASKVIYGTAQPHLHVNYGYVLTCHKSQGSEWPEVLVVVEPTTNIASHEGRRWLYTAITRAKEKVSLCILPV